MDNFDTESNCSDRSDSLKSNASSLSGLSFYGTEFAELRHLINPSKYPTPYLGRSSTPKADLASFEHEEIEILKTNLQQSLQLNEQYRNDLQSTERKIELKFNDKIDKLLRKNTRLEGELENANNQIKRILQNYKEKNELLLAKQKLDLEKKLHEKTSMNSSLRIQCANLNQEKSELDFENKNLKINLKELLTDKDIKNASIQSLKQKISEQHIELENYRKNNNILMIKLKSTSSKLEQTEKSRTWYKEELHQCQNNMQTCREETLKYKNQITLLNQKVSSLNIEVSKYKNDVDQVRLQALKEKEKLFKKLENINLNCNPLNLLNEKLVNSEFSNDNDFSENNSSSYELAIEDLKEEISRIKTNSQDREEEFEKLKQENCELIAKCLLLQKNLQQNENIIELFENSKKELIKKLQFLKESEKEKIKENLHIRNKVTELDIELKMRNQEKENVENTIRVIREQFYKFKENHEKVVHQLNAKNKEILELQKEKQELFMRNNWSICELEKIKEKEFIIEKLKRDTVKLETHIAELTQKIRDLEFQIIKNCRIISEKDNLVSEKIKELENHNTVIMQYKAMTCDYENKINILQKDLKEVENQKNELEENFKIVKAELKRKDLKLDKVLKDKEQLQNDHRHILEKMSIKNNDMLNDYKALEEKYNNKLYEKDVCITSLENKFKQFKNDYDNYVKRITDDQKAVILLNHKNISLSESLSGAKDVDCREESNNCKILKNTSRLSLFPYNNLENIIMNVFDNLNMEELESAVGIRLKHLDEKLQKIKIECEEGLEKLTNQYGKNKIKELEILLQVKDRDMEDKQKKMDKNNRTLLRKVKEHMRGRNSAEKQLKYLQDLYNSLSDDHNTVNLSISSKECEIQTLEKLCENYKTEGEKLRSTVLNMEWDLGKNRICEKCLEMDQLKEKLCVMKDLKEINTLLESKLKYSEDNILNLTEKVREQDAHRKSLQEEINILSKKIEEYKTLLTTFRDLESKYFNQNNYIKELSQKLTEKENICVTNYTAIESLNAELERANEKILSLSDKIKILSSDLQQKVEYSEELLQTIATLENNFSLKNVENQNLIADLRSKLTLLQNEFVKLKNDKMFLQRLSNDLKVALESYVEHNKNLKEQLNQVTKEKQQFNSLPPNVPDDISISGRYDEKYINQLLEENSLPVRSSLSDGIQDCLSKLREEIFSLQDQIIKKNGVGK